MAAKGDEKKSSRGIDGKEGKEALRLEVTKNIRALLISAPNGLSVAEMQRDYNSMIGKPLPFREMGYKMPIDLLKDLPNVTRPTWENGVLVLRGESVFYKFCVIAVTYILKLEYPVTFERCSFIALTVTWSARPAFPRSKNHHTKANKITAHTVSQSRTRRIIKWKAVKLVRLQSCASELEERQGKGTE